MIDQDLPCAKCEYNLRALSPEGLCPECGNPIRQSLNRWGECGRPSPTYRLVRVAIISATAASWMVNVVGCSLIGGSWTNWTPERWLGYRLCCETRPVLAITAMGSLALLAISRRARRDHVVWICLLLSVIAWLWFLQHAQHSFSMLPAISNLLHVRSSYARPHA